MDITYLGHSSFKIRGKVGTVVTDPYSDYVGFSMPGASADVITVSHDHKDHNQVEQVKTTSRRDKPFIIDQVGEYEIADISVFGVSTWHDATGGVERGSNTIFTILIDGVSVCHLGDLGHELTEKHIAAIGDVDVLLCPVGGVFTINPKQAVSVIHSLDPRFVIPMHYKTTSHEATVFGELATLEDFLKEYGTESKPEAKLTIDPSKLPEETELVVLTPSL